MIDWNNPPPPWDDVLENLVRKTPNKIVYDIPTPIDPEILMTFARRVMPTLIAYDIMGVSPMVAPKPPSEWWVNNDHLYYLWSDPIV